jgi:hypothetical protein
MSTFVVKAVHSSDQCPSANAKVRERAIKMGEDMPALAAQSGITFVQAPLILGAKHETLVIVEANSAADVNDFLFNSGLIQWNAVEVTLCEPIEDAFARFEQMPDPIY